MSGEHVTFTLNGRELTVPPGTTILRAAQEAGISIPYFCWHPCLSIAANCRMCLVEVEKAPKLLTACSTTVTDGMVVRSDSEKAITGQKATLEFILTNHPLDCPICDKSGECRLQDNYFAFSGQDSRFREPKTHKRKVVDLGPKIVLDAERCVLCTVCVRFYEEVVGRAHLGIVNRGTRSELTTFREEPLDTAYDLNITDICPVGALTARDFRFRKRVWFLTATPSVCPHCEQGCNIWVEHDQGRVYRIRPRENAEVNGPWMCDAGRLSYRDLRAEDRVRGPWIRKDGVLVEADWDEALRLVAEKLTGAKGEAAGIVGPRATVEEIFTLRHLFREVLRAGRLAPFHTRRGMIDLPRADEVLVRADGNPNRRGLETLVAGGGTETPEDLFATCRGGRVKALLVWDPGLAARSEDAAATTEALRAASFCVVLAHRFDATTEVADVVLPAAAGPERAGTYVRFDDQVQHFEAAAPPAGGRTDLEILTGLFGAMGAPWWPTEAREVFTRVAAEEPFFSGKRWDDMGGGPLTVPERRISVTSNQGSRPPRGGVD